VTWVPSPLVGSSGGSLTTFQVAGVFEALAARMGRDLFCEGMDGDECYGFAAMTDTSLVAILQQHQAAYNYIIVDGDPIWLVRRAVGADLEIDAAVDQEDFIPPRKGGNALQVVRTDVMALPAEVEVSYIDPDRDFAINTQSYRHPGAPQTGGKLTVPIGFVLNADQARSMAADILWRKWGAPLTLTFVHPDIGYQPADILQINARSGDTYVGQIMRNSVTLDRTNEIELALLLTQQGVLLPGGRPDGVDQAGDDFGAWLFTV